MLVIFLGSQEKPSCAYGPDNPPGAEIHEQNFKDSMLSPTNI